MELIPQDQTMSCWFASGQMLISWRQRTQQQCEAGHPDPALVEKWSKLYDDNPGITNDEIQSFADDLGLAMVGRMTPSPDYVEKLLREHDPLWVNGNGHITVIAGIRSSDDGYDVLVFDPAKADEPGGAWHDFNEEYGLPEDPKSLDASEKSQTSMLYLAD